MIRSPPEEGLIRIAATVKDLPEIDRITRGIVKVLKKFGGYEPEVDDIWVYQIAAYTVYLKKGEIFLDADSATVHTYTHVADTQLKFQKIIENAMKQLALRRRDRIGQQAETDLRGKLRESLERMRKPRANRNRSFMKSGNSTITPSGTRWSLQRGF